MYNYNYKYNIVATTKAFFPNIADRLKLLINPSPNFTVIVTGHGKLKT